MAKKKNRGPAPNVQPWGYMPPGSREDDLARMEQAALAQEEARKKQVRTVAALLGLGALAGGGGPGGQSGQSGQSGPKTAATAPPVRRGGGGGDKPLGRSPGDVAAAQSKVFPMAMLPAAGAAAGAGTAAAAGTAAGFLASPVGGATVAAGVDLAGGLLGSALGGGSDEELAKDQLRAQRQMNLFDGFRAWNDRLDRRNAEMRAVLARLGS